jgi:gluconolactonase
MIFTKGLYEPEGPVALADKSWLVVEMDPNRGCVTHISQDGKKIHSIAKTGRPNGLALDRHGIVWVAESMFPSLLKMSLDGQVEVFLRDCNGLPFIFPNDLCFGPDGLLYLTDSGIFIKDFAPMGIIRPDYATCQPDGRVFQINTHSGYIAMVDRGIRFTNGIAIGPDGNLYVNETLTGNIYRYTLKDGVAGPRKLFGNVIDPQAEPGYKGPDGMKFGQDGRLYCTVYGQQDVTVLEPNGSISRRIRTHGKKPTNIAFGTGDSKYIYVTEVEYGQLEMHEVETTGFNLYY